MKKIIAMLLLVVVAVSMFAACSGSYTCDICGQEKEDGKHEVEVLGEEVIYCDYCYENLGGKLLD